MFDSPYDISTFEATGFIHLWFWVEDEALLQTNSENMGLIELNDSKSNTYSLSIAACKPKTGWNELCIPLWEAIISGADLTDITSFRLFQYVTETTEIRMDGLELWMPDQTLTIPFLGGGADYLLGAKAHWSFIIS